MADLLLELLSEEIPARMQYQAASTLRRLVTDRLGNAGLTYEDVHVYWTPRRLTPQSAIAGFVRSAKLDDISQADIVHDPVRGDYYITRTAKRGRSAQMIIAEAIPDIIRHFPWPKSMRWGMSSLYPGSLRWVRPLHSILCLLTTDTDSEVIDFEVGGIHSDNITYGHRFMCNRNPIVIHNFADYTEKLEQAKVVLDAERRRNIILTDAQNLCVSHGLELISNNELVEEVTGLVEWPVVLIGQFDEQFLIIPPEIIRRTIHAHQKCFVTRKRGDTRDALSNHFILISNIETKDNGKEIAAGYSKVIRARLSDALYFWHKDLVSLPKLDRYIAASEKFGLDLKKPLDQRMAHLDHLNVAFHAKLGTQGEQVARIAALSVKIAPIVGANPTFVYRAATLAKADLQTEIISEFPELQGHMGHQYAILQGENASVSLAIEEHYQPKGPTDSVPRNPVSIAVALADKIDTLVGFWMIDEKPTGSKDPYALRRIALGIIRLVLSQNCKIHLMYLLREASHLLSYDISKYQDAAYNKKAVEDQEALFTDIDLILDDLLAFFHERLRVYLRDHGVRHDVIEAVPRTDDLVQMTRCAEALIAFINTDDGNKLLNSIKRVISMLDMETKKNTIIAATIDQTRFREKEEVILNEAISKVEKKITPLIREYRFTPALFSLPILIDSIDAFFKKVLVNDANMLIRANRLAVLDRLYNLISQFADFKKITSKK